MRKPGNCVVCQTPTDGGCGEFNVCLDCYTSGRFAQWEIQQGLGSAEPALVHDNMNREEPTLAKLRQLIKRDFTDEEIEILFEYFDSTFSPSEFFRMLYGETSLYAHRCKSL